MMRVAVFIFFVVAASVGGCVTSKDPTASREDPEDIAKQILAAMTTPEIMKLDYEGPHAESGFRGMRQREIARPLMRRLIACGKAAEQPLGKLLADEDESVRRSCVMLVNQSLLSNRGEVEIKEQAIIELSIPSLEKVLRSEDLETRWIAIGILGDFSSLSDSCLERLRLTLPMLQEIRQYDDESLRGVAEAACNAIFYHLTKRGKSLEIRQQAVKDLEQLNQDTKASNP